MRALIHSLPSLIEWWSSPGLLTPKDLVTLLAGLQVSEKVLRQNKERCKVYTWGDTLAPWGELELFSTISAEIRCGLKECDKYQRYLPQTKWVSFIVSHYKTNFSR